MTLGTCKKIRISDNLLKMLNLEVALSSFWQLARNWRQGEEAKLELSCEDGNLQIQLSASLGHPDI